MALKPNWNDTADKTCECAKFVYERYPLSDKSFRDGGVSRSQDLIRWIFTQSSQDPNIYKLQRELQNFSNAFDENLEDGSSRLNLQKIFKEIELIKPADDAPAAATSVSEDAANEICECAKIVYQKHPLVGKAYNDGGVSRSAELIKWIFAQDVNDKKMQFIQEKLVRFGHKYKNTPTGINYRNNLQKIFKSIELIKKDSDAQAAATLESNNATPTEAGGVRQEVSFEGGESAWNAAAPDYEVYRQAMITSAMKAAAGDERDPGAEATIAAFLASQPPSTGPPDGLTYTRALVTRAMRLAAGIGPDMAAEAQIAAFQKEMNDTLMAMYEDQDEDAMDETTA